MINYPSSKMKFKDTLVIEPSDMCSISSSSMSGYDLDVEDIEIELRGDRFAVEKCPNIVIMGESHSWEHDERLVNYSIFKKR